MSSRNTGRVLKDMKSAIEESLPEALTKGITYWGIVSNTTAYSFWFKWKPKVIQEFNIR